MKQGVFITATGTDIGKTELACRLMEGLRTRGLEPIPRKPVVSGFGPPLANTDPGRLLRAAGWPDERLDEVAPHRFPDPLAPIHAAAAAGRSFGYDDFIEAAGGPGFRVVEGVGGLMVPLDGERTVLDAIVELQLPVILVAGTYLGTLSHTLTAWRALGTQSALPARVVLSESLDPPMPTRSCVEALEGPLGHRPFVFPRQGRGDLEALVSWCTEVGACAP
ncbi:MAG: dethiobiotin synthase [Myxococcota bacterium]